MSGRTAVVRPLSLPPNRRVLVVSDIHGNLPFLKGLLQKANFSQEDILIILGDILERNEGSLDTLRYVMELSQRYTVHTVLGNCDHLVVNFADGKDELSDEFYHKKWFRLGERSVLVQMARLAGVSLDSPADYPAARAALRERFRAELDFLRSLPHILVNEDYIFVHGGIPREERLEELNAYGCMKNDDFLGQGHSFRRWVVVGHWPVTLYRTDIASAKPLIDEERHIISVDGGCSLKWDGQLNALVLPAEPNGAFSYFSYDGYPERVALDSQAASADPINIRYGHSRVDILERGAELCRCRHGESGRELDILTEYLQERDGEIFCEDSTDYLLPVTAGERLTVVRTVSDRALCKKDGVTGWYFGRLT